MTLLSICQNVADVNGFPRPSTVSSGTDALSRQLFGLAKKALEAVSKYKDWPHLRAEHTFTTVIGTEKYSLPIDFRKIISPSAYNTSQYYEVRGSISPADWQARKYDILATIYCYKYRLFYNTMEFGISPEPQQADDLVFEYLSSNWAYDPVGLMYRSTYMLDTDGAIVPESLVELDLNWRFRRAKGLDYSAEIEEYNATVNAEYSRFLDMPIMPIGAVRIEDPLTQGYVPEGDFPA